MSSILSSSQCMVFATAMAVSGTFILLALRLQKSPNSTPPQFIAIDHPVSQSPPPCISSEEKKREREKKKKKQKRVHFAEDVVDPTGNSDEYRKLHARSNNNNTNSNSKSSSAGNCIQLQEMPANRVALYSGILRDRLVHRVGAVLLASKSRIWTER